MASYRKIVFINYRLRSDGDQYVCWLPMHELLMSRALKEAGVSDEVEIYTLYTHEKVSDYLPQWTDADVFVCWETFARGSRYVEHYFPLAEELKAAYGKPVLFGGYWATSYGEDYPEFRVFDGVFQGYSIDGVVNSLAEGADTDFVRPVHGSSDFAKYDLDLSTIATPLDRYVVLGTLQGYFLLSDAQSAVRFA